MFRNQEERSENHNKNIKYNLILIIDFVLILHILWCWRNLQNDCLFLEFFYCCCCWGGCLFLWLGVYFGFFCLFFYKYSTIIFYTSDVLGFVWYSRRNSYRSQRRSSSKCMGSTSTLLCRYSSFTRLS